MKFIEVPILDQSARSLLKEIYNDTDLSIMDLGWANVHLNMDKALTVVEGYCGTTIVYFASYKVFVHPNYSSDVALAIKDLP